MSPNGRIMVTGASGYLAHRLVPIACAASEVVAVSRRRPDHLTLGGAEWHSVDVLDADAVDAIVDQARPDAIINAVAANPGQGESYAVNVDGARNVATAAARHDIRLVHVSTDIVHSGQQAPYADDATPDPVNEYGRSKAEGESIIAAITPEAAMVRTSLIYGLERIDRGTESFKAVIDRGEQLTLWHDAIRHPVWVDALAHGLVRLATELREEAGTVNLAGGEAMSRADFGRTMLEHWGVDASSVAESTVTDHPTQAADLRLLHDRAQAIGLDTPSVAEVLASR